MIVWLDMKLFGNGYGMGMPSTSGVLYWLVDDLTGRGEFYHWIGGHGAQLESFGWKPARVGSERRLRGFRFRAFNASESRVPGLRFRNTWAMEGAPKDIDGMNRQIAELKRRIDSPFAPYNGWEASE